MAEFDIWRDVLVDGNVAATKNLQRLFVELHDALTCFAERLHGWVEGDGVLLAIATESHLIEADVCHLRIASLENGLVAVGFEIATDLVWYVSLFSTWEKLQWCILSLGDQRSCA